MARKIRQRSRKGQIITIVVAGGLLLVLHSALVALLALGYIDGRIFVEIIIEIFLWLDLPFIAMVLFFLRNDLRRWRRSRKESAQPFLEKRP